MMISTRGRYALRVLIDLAEHAEEGYIPMKDVAERQAISLKYLEKLMPVLTGAHLIEGVHGKGGGYRLTKEPAEYVIGDVLRLMEGSLSPVACLEQGAPPCPRASFCKTLPLWSRLNRAIADCLDSVTLAELLQESSDNYVI
ncbi:MAG: RrF2 family transcriptional regulator [Firmicutes bacterium]|nr:RrF2 family transcriptional regulator [Bacillota bacterium]